jgi:hypothetical protein
MDRRPGAESCHAHGGRIAQAPAQGFARLKGATLSRGGDKWFANNSDADAFEVLPWHANLIDEPSVRDGGKRTGRANPRAGT